MKTITIKKNDGKRPEWIYGTFGFKYSEGAEHVNNKGYINFDICKGKEGGYYIKVNDFRPNPKAEMSEQVVDDIIPF